MEHPLRAIFSQEKKAHQRNQVKHVQHSSANSIPAIEEPLSLHARMQLSALLLDPARGSDSRGRVLASFESLFAKRTHPSQVRISERKAMRGYSQEASHEEPILRVLRNSRKRLEWSTIRINVHEIGITIAAATELIRIAGASGIAVRGRIVRRTDSHDISTIWHPKHVVKITK